MTRVLLLGGGLPALAAGLDLASVGIEVQVAGGQHWAPEGEVRDPEGEVAAFLAEIEAPIVEGGPGEPGAALVQTAPDRVWLRSKKGTWAQQPVPEILGIPAVPLATDCMRMLGTGGAFRAAVDRLKPVLTIGQQENLARLVETRMGVAARTLLVEPLVRERFGVPAAEAEVSVVAPGLNEGMSRVGSLSGGVDQNTDRHVARETRVAPAAGWLAFTARVLERLGLYNGQPFDQEVVRLEPTEAGWIAHDTEGTAHRFDAIVADPESLSRLLGGGATAAVKDAAAAEDTAAGAPGGQWLALRAAALVPSRKRSYAETGIKAPSNVPASGPHSGAGGAGQPLTLVESVTDGAGNVWSVRQTREADRGWRARFSGPVEQLAPGTPAAPIDLPGLLRAAKLVAAPGEAVTYTLAAPYSTEAARDADAAALLAWEEVRGDALVCGTELHGSELGTALGEVRQQAVRLRRRLLGIAA